MRRLRGPHLLDAFATEHGVRRRSRLVKTTITVFYFAAALTLTACEKPMSQPATQQQFARDFATPQGAILSLENAYRKRDIEAAVRCKHFPTEAKLMLKKMGRGLETDSAIVAQTAEVLELSFRKHTEAAWPDFTGIVSYFVDQRPYADGIVIVSEGFRYPDGGTAIQKHYVTLTPAGWRVLNLAE